MQISIDQGLFEWPAAEPRLIGSECADCGVVAFPRQGTCPRCCGENVAPRKLGSRGTLWTWTTQEFPPKAPYAGPTAPGEFRPYLVGYVELPGEVIVESRLEADPSHPPAIGTPMQLVFRPLYTNERGEEVVTYAFAPVTEAAR